MNVSLVGSASYISGSYGQPYCPSNGSYPAGAAVLTDTNSFYRVAFTAQDGGLGTAQMESFESGAVQPKYIVLSVIYAPPGGGTNNQSYVDYTGTTEVGTDTSFNNSFQNSSIVTMSAGFFGVTASLTTTQTQEVDTSSSLSVNQSTAVSDEYPGSQPASTAIGLNHDNDIILLWLNPVLDCVDEPAWSYMPTYGNAIQCIQYDPNAAGGNPNQQNVQVVQLAAGWLNGDYSMQSQNPTLYNTLQQDGITSAQYSTILASDPYGTCGSSISCVQAIGIPSGHFDDTSTPVSFENLGNTRSYTASYTATSSQGKSSSSSYAISYALGGSVSFKNIFTESLKEQNTLTWMNKWSAATTSMVGQAATAHVTEPNASSGYTGPIGFEIYKDNTFGSFMFYPTN